MLINKNIPIIAGYDPILDMGINYSNEIDLSAIKEGDSVLHIGCDTGDYTFTIRGIVGSSGRVIGIDYSMDNVSLARQNCGYFGYNNVTFFQKDIRNLQFSDCCFDIIVCSYALNLFANKEEIYKEIYRLVKPNGKIITADIFICGNADESSINAIIENYYKIAKLRLTDNVVVHRKREIAEIFVEVGFKDVQISNDRNVNFENGEILLYLSDEQLSDFASNGCCIVLINGFGTK